MPIIRRLPEGSTRLVCTEGTSNKFYDVILHAAEDNQTEDPRGDWCFTAHYGARGQVGSKITKEFRGRNNAVRAMEKQIKSKLNKGYVEVLDSEEIPEGTKFFVVGPVKASRPKEQLTNVVSSGRRRAIQRD